MFEHIVIRDSIFREQLTTESTSEQAQLPVARLASQELQHRRMVSACQPFRFGHESPSDLVLMITCIHLLILIVIRFQSL
jgi:hypothetical protein